MANCGYYCVMYALYSGPNADGEFLGYTDPVVSFREESPISLVVEPAGSGSRVVLVVGGPSATIGEAASKCGNPSDGAGCLSPEESSNSSEFSQSGSGESSDSGSFSYSESSSYSESHSHSLSHSNSKSHSHSDSGSESHSDSSSEAGICSLGYFIIETVSATKFILGLENLATEEIVVINMGFDNTTATFDPEPPYILGEDVVLAIEVNTTLPYAGGKLTIDNNCPDGPLVIDF